MALAQSPTNLQPTPQQPPRRAERPVAPDKSFVTAPSRPETRYQALQLAVSLATDQTPAKAIIHLADAFEAWLTRPLGGE
jgi:hypothetical protein